jgi:hypothetical protein
MTRTITHGRIPSRLLTTLAIAALAIAAAPADADAQPQSPGSAEERAVAYLSAEVPRWRREHPCFSCHNNGDAARALIAAASRGFAIGPAMDDTLVWLRQPERWDENAQGGGIDDKPLARIQFAGALTSAAESGMADRSALRTAGTIVAKDQSEDGSWRLDSSQSVGSPATYGTVLATWAARRTLAASGAPSLTASVARADRWLRTFEPKNMLDAAAVVLALADAADERGREQRAHALDLLQKGQAPDGGWGLYATSASEPFDTAVALLGLSALRQSDSRVSRARQFLISRQLPDGSWPETTRPSGQESYAQRISTSGWATLALLATLPPQTRRQP